MNFKISENLTNLIINSKHFKVKKKKLDMIGKKLITYL